MTGRGGAADVSGPAGVAALAVHIMSSTALTGATYDIEGDSS